MDAGESEVHGILYQEEDVEVCAVIPVLEREPEVQGYPEPCETLLQNNKIRNSWV